MTGFRRERIEELLGTDKYATGLGIELVRVDPDAVTIGTVGLFTGTVYISTE